MTTLVILEATAKDGTIRELLDLFSRLLPQTRVYGGCQGVDMHLDEDGKTVLLLEWWDSKAHHQQYLAWREETGALAELAALLDGPPLVRYFAPVDPQTERGR